LASERVERRLTAILSADVAGYSRLMGADEAGTLAQLKAHRRELIDPKIKMHGGRIVKTTGDGILFWQLNVLKLAPLRAYALWNGRVVVDPDDAMIFVPILIWCEAAQPMLIAAAMITPAAAIWLGLPSWHSGRPARLR
jgi:class 3 adenylate cyclase